MARTKTETMSLRALKVLVTEAVTEGADEYARLLEKVSRAEPGSARFHELLADLCTAANVMAVKAKVAEEAIDEYLESLPDDDD